MSALPTILQILYNVYDSTVKSLSVGLITREPDAFGLSATGADSYATILTPSENKSHLYVYNEGVNPVILSLDAGNTDHFYVPGQTALMFDTVLIQEGIVVQAKNGSAGNNYTNLRITIW